MPNPKSVQSSINKEDIDLLNELFDDAPPKPLSKQEENRLIAETIIQQLGGAGPVKSMLGIKVFTYGEKSVSFKFKGNREFNWINIRLTPKDLYEVTFSKISTNGEIKKQESVSDIYCDQLKSLIEEKIQLRLTLF